MATLTHVSAADFARMAAVLGPCELVEGEILRTAPGGIARSKVTLRVAFVLETWNVQARRGHVLTNEAGVLVSRDPDTVRGARRPVPA